MNKLYFITETAGVGKRIIKSLSKSVLLFVLVFMITGCSSMTGKYKISEVKDGNTTLKSNTNYSLIIKSNKTAILKMDEDIKLKYNDKYFYSIDNDTDKIYYTYNNNKIVLEIDDMKLVFKKK